jgi:hypothetical protein
MAGLGGCRPRTGAPAAPALPVAASPAPEPDVFAFTFKNPLAEQRQSELLAWVENANAGEAHVLLFAETGDPTSTKPGHIRAVQDPEHWPDDILTTYVLALDSEHRGRYLQIVPQSQSGDWNESQDFLFNDKGNLVFWRLEFAWFHDGDVVSKFRVSIAFDDRGRTLERQQQGAKPNEHKLPELPDAPTLKGLLAKLRIQNAARASGVRG